MAWLYSSSKCLPFDIETKNLFPWIQVLSAVTFMDWGYRELIFTIKHFVSLVKAF